MYYSLAGPDLLPRAQSENSCCEGDEVNEEKGFCSYDFLVVFKFHSLCSLWDCFIPMNTDMFL